MDSSTQPCSIPRSPRLPFEVLAESASLTGQPLATGRESWAATGQKWPKLASLHGQVLPVCMARWPGGQVYCIAVPAGGAWPLSPCWPYLVSSVAWPASSGPPVQGWWGRGGGRGWGAGGGGRRRRGSLPWWVGWGQVRSGARVGHAGRWVLWPGAHMTGPPLRWARLRRWLGRPACPPPGPALSALPQPPAQQHCLSDDSTQAGLPYAACP